MARTESDRTTLVSEPALLALVTRAFVGLGMSPANAPHVAASVVAAERDGAASHGLLRMPGYAGSLRAGWADGAAVPEVTAHGASVLRVDGRNGFAQVALAAVRDRATAAARASGLCTVSLRDVHHFAALWPDVEPFAEAGLIAISMVNSRPYMTGWNSRGKVFGTNPVAFACPRPLRPPLVWDQASSLRAQGEVLIARRDGTLVPEGAGVDADGAPTTDPARILDGGALLPFAGAKGSNVALMVEILVAALGGSAFGLEVKLPADAQAQTSRTGQFLLLIDPGFGNAAFDGRIASLLGLLGAAGITRLPSDRRLERRERSRAAGIALTAERHRQLVEWAR